LAMFFAAARSRGIVESEIVESVRQGGFGLGPEIFRQIIPGFSRDNLRCAVYNY
jgi:hypothetical protein